MPSKNCNLTARIAYPLDLVWRETKGVVCIIESKDWLDSLMLGFGI